MAYQHFDELIGSIKGSPKKHVVVVAPHDSHTFEAVSRAAEEGFVNYTLCGVKERMEAAAKEAGLSGLDALRDDPSCCGIHFVPDEKEAAETAVRLIDEGKGDFLLKGSLSSEILLRVVLHTELDMFGKAHMSHISVIEIPTYKKLFGITDGGMMPHPNLEEKEIILENALNVFRRMGYERPVVALLCATERVSPRMIETSDAETIAAKALSGKYGKCTVDGPMAFDLAFSKESAAIKRYESPVTGDFDVLLTPEITCANMLTKSMICCVPGSKMAGCIVGARMLVALASRGAAAEEKYLSILLCAAQLK